MVTVKQILFPASWPKPILFPQALRPSYRRQDQVAGPMAVRPTFPSRLSDESAR
jgi:hypothetical protein